MRFVIDLQGAQCANAQRGIGRYSLAIAKGIALNRGGNEVLIVLNGLFAESIEPIRAEFDGLLSQDSIRVWYPPQRVAAANPDNDWRRTAAQYIREAFLASLCPDVVYVTSFIEGLNDDAVTSVGTLSNDVPTVVTVYDFIPFIHRSLYLDDPNVERWYMEKLDHLRRAHLWLAISQSSRMEGIEYIGLPAESVVAVPGAADDRFQPIEISRVDERAIRKKYGLPKPFLMYGGGIDHRKNVETLIRSFATLPEDIRSNHQLAIVCDVQPESQNSLIALGKQLELRSEELVLTGYVPDGDLVALYNLCELFVFPSWHEGFGLPVLEAMACGAPVISANAASLPEVINRDDALFDPHSKEAMAAKILNVLSDEALRKDLGIYGRNRAQEYTWNYSAQSAIAAFESLCNKRQDEPKHRLYQVKRPKLAYVSPLPPVRSGIADYSAELIPELARHYDIDVVVSQSEISDAGVRSCFPIRTVEWFMAHAHRFDRVLYHFGNSEFHSHMFGLLDRIPGIVVLHDFFLSGIQAHREFSGKAAGAWLRELYLSHGYAALKERHDASDLTDVVFKYPCNFSVVQRAICIIVHSRYACRLADDWNVTQSASDWDIIPLLRAPPVRSSSSRARERLGIDRDVFLVCSFGMLGPTKANKRLLEAWLASPLSQDSHCRLVFVGARDSSNYVWQFEDTIRRNGVKDRVLVTGWINADEYRMYLEACDIAVQLRTRGFGETSAAVLDCMKYAKPVIVNAIGPVNELPRDSVWMLPTDFQDGALSQALLALWQDCDRRDALGTRARSHVHAHHAPRRCADQYFEAIERGYLRSQRTHSGAVKSISDLDDPRDREKTLKFVAGALAKTFPDRRPARQLLVDISELVRRDVGTGIQRVTRSVLNELLTNPPSGCRVEPVYATTDTDGYWYARRFALDFLRCDVGGLNDTPVECDQGDVFLGLDLQPHIIPAQRQFLLSLRCRGVEVYFVVYDLLAIKRPDVFIEGGKDIYTKWLNCVADFDGAVCISRTVATDLRHWLAQHCHDRLRPFKIGWFHLGADIQNSVRSRTSPKRCRSALVTLETLSGIPIFLMVGTIEPRKGYAQVLAAFEQLWQGGIEAMLVIVGGRGWLMDSFIEHLRDHPDQGKRLHWLEGISDEELEGIYSIATCLVSASEGEGFGLPLIEAAKNELPIIARDIPIFREVAGNHAYYFQGRHPGDLALAIRSWLQLYNKSEHPRSDTMPWCTWQQSTDRLADVILRGDWSDDPPSSAP